MKNIIAMFSTFFKLFKSKTKPTSQELANEFFESLTPVQQKSIQVLMKTISD
jgi:superfamily II DNA/RNA helicase